ncbi:restriction endonuclease subunit S [Vibrio sp. F74]|uniref:restriction endonuclease subunit S n=1 Tax=Vibrio sp. F74 TaxID=700020 RepID=UPI0035F5EE62
MVPNGWCDSRVKDVVKSLDAGISVNSEDDKNLSAKFKILKTSCVSKGIFVAKEVKSVKDAVEIERLKEPVLSDSIIISRMNTPLLVGANAYIELAPQNTFLPDRLWQVKPNGSKIDMCWLSYWFGSNHTRYTLSSSATGTSGSMKNITKPDVMSMKLPLPPLPEQRKIAKILSTWDKAIATNEKLIETSKQQKIALMQQLLTGKKRLVNPETGEVFGGEWQSETFKTCGIKVTDGDRGKEYPKSTDFSDSGFCLFLSAQNVTKNGFKFETTQFIDSDKHQKLRKGTVTRGDLILTTRGSVGHFAYYDESIPYSTMRVNSGMVTLTANENSIYPEYLYCLCRSMLIQHQIDIASFGSAQPQLTIQIINKLKLMLPTLREQQKIASVLTAADKEIEVLEAKLSHLKQEKKALMQQLLTGKRRVKVDTEETEAA